MRLAHVNVTHNVNFSDPYPNQNKGPSEHAASVLNIQFPSDLCGVSRRDLIWNQVPFTLDTKILPSERFHTVLFSRWISYFKFSYLNRHKWQKLMLMKPLFVYRVTLSQKDMSNISHRCRSGYVIYGYHIKGGHTSPKRELPTNYEFNED